YLPMGSSSLILPASTRSRTATAVNIFPMEPKRNFVSNVLEVLLWRSAEPQAASKIGLPLLAITTAPENRPSPASFWSSAFISAMACASDMRVRGAAAETETMAKNAMLDQHIARRIDNMRELLVRLVVVVLCSKDALRS